MRRRASPSQLCEKSRFCVSSTTQALSTSKRLSLTNRMPWTLRRTKVSTTHEVKLKFARSCLVGWACDCLVSKAVLVWNLAIILPFEIVPRCLLKHNSHFSWGLGKGSSMTYPVSLPSIPCEHQGRVPLPGTCTREDWALMNPRPWGGVCSSGTSAPCPYRELHGAAPSGEGVKLSSCGALPLKQGVY